MIFITDDTKGDWGEIQKDGTFVIDSFLAKEFEEENPDCSINFLNSENFLRLFYDEVSYKRSFIELNLKRDDFIQRIEAQIKNLIEDYIIKLNLNSLPNVKTDMVDNIEIIQSDLLDYEVSYFEDCDDYLHVGYDVSAEVYVEFDSYLYSGRDQDTKEITYDAGSHPEFLIQLDMQLSRNIYYYQNNFSDMDFKIDDFGEVNYIEENYKEYGDENYFEISNNFKDGEYICPDCGVELTGENDTGGICIDCYNK